MRSSNYKKAKHVMINALGIALLVIFSNSTVIAKEPSAIAGGDLGSGRIKAETVKPNRKPSKIAGGDLGSGRIRAETVEPNRKPSGITNGDLGSGRIKAETVKPN